MGVLREQFAIVGQSGVPNAHRDCARPPSAARGRGRTASSPSGGISSKRRAAYAGRAYALDGRFPPLQKPGQDLLVVAEVRLPPRAEAAQSARQTCRPGNAASRPGWM